MGGWSRRRWRASPADGRIFAAGLVTLTSLAKTAVYLGIAALSILHHDPWFWDDPTLLLGFLPVGMAYHMAYTLAAAALWYLASQYAWPRELVRFAESGGDPGGGGE